MKVPHQLTHQLNLKCRKNLVFLKSLINNWNSIGSTSQNCHRKLKNYRIRKTSKVFHDQNETDATRI